MNRQQGQGKLEGFAAKVKQQWGKLSDDEVKQAEGNLDELAAKIREKYGDTQEAVAARLNELKSKLDS